MRRDGDLHITVLDVYLVNTFGYNGHIKDLVKPAEEAIRKHGAKWFERWSGSVSWDDHEGLFSRYDRNRRIFPEFPSMERNGIQDASQASSGSSGVRGNRRGNGSSDEEVNAPFSLRETTEESWPAQRPAMMTASRPKTTLRCSALRHARRTQKSRGRGERSCRMKQ